MSYLTFDQMMRLDGRKFEDLEVPELKGTLRLAELPAGKSLEFKTLQARREKDDAVERKQMICLFVGAIVDENGAPALDEKKAGKLIDSISFKSLQLIAAKIMEMMVPEEKKAAEVSVAAAIGPGVEKKDGAPSGN